MKSPNLPENCCEYALQRGHAPLIIFENGLGATMRKAWDALLPSLDPQQARLTYNRPGYGTRPLATTPRDGAHIVAELRDLLQHLELSAPYVLVGHSMGGLYMQLFARLHPAEVAALVLIDPTHPLQFEGIGTIEQRPWWFRQMFHLFLQVHGGREELAAATKTGQQVLAAPPCPAGLPVFILQSEAAAQAESKTKNTSELDRYSHGLKNDFLNLYPGCQLEWVSSGHNIQEEQPEVVLKTLQAALNAAHTFRGT